MATRGYDGGMDIRAIVESAMATRERLRFPEHLHHRYDDRVGRRPGWVVKDLVQATNNKVPEKTLYNFLNGGRDLGSTALGEVLDALDLLIVPKGDDTDSLKQQVSDLQQEVAALKVQIEQSKTDAKELETLRSYVKKNWLGIGRTVVRLREWREKLLDKKDKEATKPLTSSKRPL